MADFTFNAPNTTVNPYTPTSCIVPVGTIASTTTGLRAGATGTNCCFAHDATYGSTITATATISTTGAVNGDDIVLGAVARSGANLGCGIGVLITRTTVSVCTFSSGLVITGVSTNTADTRTANDVYTVTVSISGGTATITCSKNGGANFTFNVSTTTTNAAETTLAAGIVFSPQNNNSTRISQFTGTGVAASTPGTPCMLMTITRSVAG